MRQENPGLAGGAAGIPDRYCLLYVAKNILSGVLVKGFTWDVAVIETLTVKLPVTLVNAIIAMVCAGLLYFVLKQPLQKAHVLTA